VPAKGIRFKYKKLKAFQKDMLLEQITIVTDVNIDYNSDNWFDFAYSIRLEFQSITYKNRK
jgi:hypothetical protein